MFVYATKSQQHLGPKCQIIRKRGMKNLGDIFANCKFIHHLFSNFLKSFKFYRLEINSYFTTLPSSLALVILQKTLCKLKCQPGAVEQNDLFLYDNGIKRSMPKIELNEQGNIFLFV